MHLFLVFRALLFLFASDDPRASSVQRVIRYVRAALQSFSLVAWSCSLNLVTTLWWIFECGVIDVVGRWHRIYRARDKIFVDFLADNGSLINAQTFLFFPQNGLHATHIHLIYEHENEDVILDLHLNDNLIPIDHFVSIQQPNGDKAIKNFTKTEIDLCNYQVSCKLSCF